MGKFWQKKNFAEINIHFNYRIVDVHIEFPYCMLLFDKSNKQSTKLETAVMWSKSILNMMNIYEEMYHQFMDMNNTSENFKICLEEILIIFTIYV